MPVSRFMELVEKGLGGSIGHACGKVVAVDIDILDPELAQRIRGVAENALGITPLLRVGRAPKLLMVYRASGVVRTRTVHGANGHAVEILSGGRQYVAHGIHPDTGRPYQWLVESPMDVHRNELPSVTAAQIDGFLALVRTMIGKAPKASKSKWNSTDSSTDNVVRDANRIVIDGRDFHLMQLAYEVCSAAFRAGHTADVDRLIMETVQRFNATTNTTRPRSRDGLPWSADHARKKVVDALRKLKAGTLTARRAKAKGGEWTKAMKDAYTDQVMRERPPKAALKVHMALMDDLNRDGRDTCCPSIARLVEKTRLSKSGVRHGLRWLSDKGFWKSRGIVGGRYRSAHRLPDLSLVAHLRPENPATVHSIRHVVETAAETADTVSGFDTQNLYQLVRVPTGSERRPANINDAPVPEAAYPVKPAEASAQADLFGGVEMLIKAAHRHAWITEGGKAPADIRAAIDAVQRARGHTDEQLAAIVGRSRSTLTNIKAGRYPTCPEVAAKLMAYLEAA